jgi:hypothetical protein
VPTGPGRRGAHAAAHGRGDSGAAEAARSHGRLDLRAARHPDQARGAPSYDTISASPRVSQRPCALVQHYLNEPSYVSPPVRAGADARDLPRARPRTRHLGQKAGWHTTFPFETIY